MKIKKLVLLLKIAVSNCIFLLELTSKASPAHEECDKITAFYRAPNATGSVIILNGYAWHHTKQSI